MQTTRAFLPFLVPYRLYLAIHDGAIGEFLKKYLLNFVNGCRNCQVNCWLVKTQSNFISFVSYENVKAYKV